MDFLLDARSPCDYTFNFWNDYLGLSTLVSSNRISSSSLRPNSITESLKATLGLDDSPVCSCVTAHGGDGGDGHSDTFCCCCAPPPSSSPRINIHDLKERISLLRPYEQHHLLPGDSSPAADRDSPACGGRFGGLDPLSRRKQAQRGGGRPEPRVCVFCRNNGAPEEVYGSHILKAADGRVLCPILRAYTCPLCSANGDNAHTIKYCPLSREPPGGRKGGGGGGRRHNLFYRD